MWRQRGGEPNERGVPGPGDGGHAALRADGLAEGPRGDLTGWRGGGGLLPAGLPTSTATPVLLSGAGLLRCDGDGVFTRCPTGTKGVSPGGRLLWGPRRCPDGDPPPRLPTWAVGPEWK